MSSPSMRMRPSRSRSLWQKRLGMGAGLFTLVAVLSGCSLGSKDGETIFGLRTSSILGFGYPTGITEQAQEMRNFWTWSCIAAFLVGALVWGLTFYVIVFHRKKKGDPEFPVQLAYNSKLEATYTIIPLIAVMIMFWPTVVIQNKLNKLEANPAVVVDVTAFKWNWKFGYNNINLPNYKWFGAVDLPAPPPVEKPDGPLSEAEEAKLKAQEEINKKITEHPPLQQMSADQLEELRELELKENQPHGNDISLAQLTLDQVETFGTTNEIPVLVLPVNQRIEFRIASADVVHSFYVPEFIFKRDAMPFPMAEHSDFRFQVSGIQREGSFVGRCAEMCGEYHSAMNFEIRAVSEQAFTKYLDARRSGKTNAEALASIGSAPLAVTSKPFDRG